MRAVLAKDVETAEPLVEEFARKVVAPALGELNYEEFYRCDPSTYSVMNIEGQRWTEGGWGAAFLCRNFSSSDLLTLQELVGLIKVDEFKVTPHLNASLGVASLRIELWFSARLEDEKIT